MARPCLTDQLRQNLAACRTADEVMQAVLRLATVVPHASQGTHRKWSRLAQKRIEAIAAERHAASAAAPLIWMPPASTSAQEEKQP
jgi:hypothetical protein